MIKPISFTIILLVSLTVSAQKLNSHDSLLIKKYWNRIYPISITSKSGNLYSNINNYLELKFIDDEIVPFRITLKTNNGTLVPENNKFITFPKYAGNSYISIYIITSNDDTLLIGKKKFTVLHIPDPCLKVGNTVINEKSAISRNVLLRGDSLKLFFTDDLPESSHWYNIEYFNSGYTYGGSFFYEDNKGPLFSKNAISAIKKQHPGQELVIKVVSISPKAEHFRIMPIIRFRML